MTRIEYALGVEFNLSKFKDKIILLINNDCPDETEYGSIGCNNDCVGCWLKEYRGDTNDTP